MRRSVADAVVNYVRKHPQLFEPQTDASGSEEEDEGEAAAPKSPPPASAARHAAPASPNRRSPRDNLSSRSAAAAAVAELNAYAPPKLSPLPSKSRSSESSSSRRRAATAAAAAAAVGAAATAASRPPLLQLIGAGGSDPSSDSDSSSDGEGAEDSLDNDAALLRRGGRLHKEEFNRQMASAGISRSFAAGFIANAQFAAGGRSMYQLYTEITSKFSSDKQHCVRECLALARVLDSLMRDDYAEALESVCRRLGGVHTAAETGNWAMCERLETEAKQRSFVPDHFMRSALKSVTQMQAVKKSVAASGYGAKGNYSSGGSGKSSGSSRGYKKETNTDNKGTGAGASYKKKGGSDSK
jgi:hypothetical protein